VTAQSVESPVNHLLITVTNTGSKLCDLYYYPAVRFQDAQSVPPVIKETQPQAVTTLAPGESGYAGVILSAGTAAAPTATQRRPSRSTSSTATTTASARPPRPRCLPRASTSTTRSASPIGSPRPRTPSLTEPRLGEPHIELGQVAGNPAGTHG
jgi:hypothetical protein